MAQVTVKINGFTYSVGCEDGQEGHLQAMAGQIETRIDSIKSLGNQSGEARLLVLAALLMADELHDMTIEMASLRSAKPRPAASSATSGAPSGAGAQLTQRLSQLAARAEEIAAQLEHP